MKIFILVCLASAVAGSEVTLSYGGSGIQCSSKLEFQFGLSQLVIKDVNDALVRLEIPDKTTRDIKGEPDLPVLREFVALPHRGNWKAVVENVVTEKHVLQGKRVVPSKGALFLSQNPADIPFTFGDAYLTVSKLPVALLREQHTMRDVDGAILEINPIVYDPVLSELTIVVSATIKLISSDLATDKVTKIVDATFYDLYEFHYINFHHYGGINFLKGDDLGRMAIFYDSKFKDSATAFAATKKGVLKDTMLAQCDSSSNIKSAIKKYYGESDSLTYVVLFGTSCPTFNCQKSRRECDVQYAQLSGDENDVTLDVFVSRIAADSQSEVDAQLQKFADYEANGNLTDWDHETSGLALDLIGDEYKYMHRNLDKMTSFGFSKATFWTDKTATSTMVNDAWNTGMGIYFYIGHGSGTAWNCPQRTGGMTERDIGSKLHNNHMYPFVLECSCLNGGFKKESPCFAQAMMSKAAGGAISMYSSAPVAQSSSPKDLQSGAVDALTSKKATRVGPIYYAGIMYAYKLKPSQALYTLEGYNMFGDPSLQLNFLRD